MIQSVIYRSKQSRVLSDGSTFIPVKSPIFHIIFAKIVIFVLIFLLGDILPQIYSTIIVAVAAGLSFWITKNMGRLYLQATWYIDCQGEEDIWVY